MLKGWQGRGQVTTAQRFAAAVSTNCCVGLTILQGKGLPEVAALPGRAAQHEGRPDHQRDSPETSGGLAILFAIMFIMFQAVFTWARPLIISAFIPATTVWGVANLQGLVMFGLFAAGILTALCVSAACKFLVWRDNPTPSLHA